MSDNPNGLLQDELLKRLRELEEELSFYHHMMNYIPGHIYWLDQNNRYLGCNQEHANNIGLSNRLDIVGKTNDDMPWKEIAETVNQTNREVMRTGEPVTIKETGLINGVQSTFLSQKVPLKNKNNETVGIMGISINITEIEQLQKSLIEAKKGAEAASQAKTEFLENMRHDIRTPLTGIVGFADLLKMESDNPHIKEYSENLVASSHALLDLLDEVLEAIRVSSGEIPRLKKKFDLKAALEHVIKLNMARAAQKRLSLSLQFDEAIPRYVIGDKVRIHRIILELVANALNFTDTGFVKLSAHLAKQEGKQLVLMLVVEDSGMGIPKDKQQEIYVQFKRLTPSYQGIYKGAGLGLSVVKQFVDELNGEIYVKSEPRKGSSFTCVIPLQEPLLDNDLGMEEQDSLVDQLYETTYAQQIKPPPCPSVESAEHRVLVVEDNIIAQHAARSLLSKLQCAVDIAEDGKTALDLWKTQHYDLILMDIGLPDVDGYEVTHAIRVQELTKKTHTPIIALTAHAGDENKKRCIDAGMNAVLTKPLTAKNCADMINAFIPGRQKELTPSQLASSTERPPLSLAEFPLLDIAEGIKTLGAETNVADMLRFMITESLPEDMQKLKLAHQASDWEKTQQLIHKIKGGAVYVGTTQLKMACQYFDQYWKSGQTEQLEPLYQQTVHAVLATTQAIEDWLNEKKD
ncbi:response regulator [Legionella birminghamensis]|uniref:histidine kinase n=3 Tax=Legionella birminghamensis TaxID=28083 RepID=A0A378JRM5_9GAMM|nr:response regulator [Legionella birminghamensis]STX61026.1 sensory histidine-kinase / response regulator [Legionella birminghamensis]